VYRKTVAELNIINIAFHKSVYPSHKVEMKKLM